MPISIGGDQAAGSVVLAHFRVVEGGDYQIIFGLDFMVPLDFILAPKRCRVTYLRGSMEGNKDRVTLPLYKWNTVRVQPVARLHRDRIL